MSEVSLFDRLDGAEGIDRLVDDIWIDHTNNPKVKNNNQRRLMLIEDFIDEAQLNF